MIYDEGDVSDSVYRLQSGCVRLQVNSAQGDRQIVQFLLPGDVFGICPTMRNTAAEAVTPVLLERYPLRAVLEEGFASPAVASQMLDGATAAYQELAHHVEKIVHLSAMEKVRDFYEWLNLRLQSAGVASRRPPMSQRDIADYLGMAPETLSRCIRQFLSQRSAARAARRKAATAAERDCTGHSGEERLETALP